MRSPPVFVVGWQQFASSLLQELLPTLAAFPPDVPIVEPVVVPGHHAGIQPFANYGLLLSNVVFLPPQTSPERFVSPPPQPSLRRVVALLRNETTLTLAKQLLSPLPSSSTVVFVRVPSLSAAVDAIRTTSTDAFVYFMRPEPSANTSIPNPAFAPSLLQRARRRARDVWDRLPDQCLHVRFEKLQETSSPLLLSRAAARLHNDTPVLFMHDAGPHGSATYVSNHSHVLLSDLRGFLRDRGVLVRSLCQEFPLDPACGLLDAALCSQACTVSVCLGGGSFGRLAMCPAATRALTWHGGRP